MARYPSEEAANAVATSVTAARPTHQGKKSRRSRLTKWPIIGFEAGGHRVREVGLTIDEFGQPAECQLLTAADEKYVVRVRVQAFRHIGGEHDRRATPSSPVLKEAQKRPSPEDVQQGGDLVGDDQLRPRREGSD